MSLFSFLLGGHRKQEGGRAAGSKPAAIRPAQGWVCVQKGTPELVRQAVQTYAGNVKKVQPGDFRVTVARHPSGFLAVTFPDGLPVYDLVNLIGWLNEPPAIAGVSGAAGWITSPSSGSRYCLQPESGNELGDTLIGTSSDGKGVQVYLPEAAMCEVATRLTPVPEPDLSRIQTGSGITFSVMLDVDPSFGNPEFKITHPRDTNWN